MPTSEPATRVQTLAPATAGLWVFLAIVVTVIGQNIRLQQSDAALWLALDYATRFAVLLILAVHPAMRRLVYAREKRRIGLIEIFGWAVLFSICLWVTRELGDLYRAAHFRSFRLGGYPDTVGWADWLDIRFGLPLVALEEELLFRRAMRAALARLGDGWAMVAVSALLFGAFHWWTGIPNIVFATVFGALAMLLYRRAGALWPCVALHVITDLIAFM